MQLFYCPGIKGGDNFLNAEESRHCTKVLRKQLGDSIQLIDGLGSIYTAELTEINQKKCLFSVNSEKELQKPDFSIHIAIAPTKSLDRIEWFVEKAVEIGVDKISFIHTAFSERSRIKLERIQKKAISAMKQSLRAHLPVIHEMEKLKAFLSTVKENQKFVAHLEGDSTGHLIDLAKPAKDYLVLIGPEGGFSEEEIALIKNNKFTVAKLGNSRLRTETAGVVTCSVLNDLNR